MEAEECQRWLQAQGKISRDKVDAGRKKQARGKTILKYCSLDSSSEAKIKCL